MGQHWHPHEICLLNIISVEGDIVFSHIATLRKDCLSQMSGLCTPLSQHCQSSQSSQYCLHWVSLLILGLSGRSILLSD